MEEGGEEMLKVVPEEARERVVPLLCVRALIPAEAGEIPRPRPRLGGRHWRHVMGVAPVEAALQIEELAG